MYMNIESDKGLLNDYELNNLVSIVMRQTDYDSDMAMEKLKKHNLNYVDVIKEYLEYNNKEKEVKNIKTVNEMIHGEIREFFK